MDNVSKPRKLWAGRAGSSTPRGTLEQFELANKPGALAELAGRLAKNGINIDCAYATVHKSAKQAVVVLALSGLPYRKACYRVFWPMLGSFSTSGSAILLDYGKP